MKKPFLIVVVLASWLSLHNSATADSAYQLKKPNIVWLSCEDISPHIGCFGDPHAITPNVDQLATEGVRYTNTFTTAGVCAPCRSGIITGVYQSTLGTHHMRCNARLPDFISPFPKYMRDAGYFCTNNSKQDYQFKTPKGTWDESGKKAHWKKRKDKSQPFFAVFNFGGCHESGIASEEKYKKVTADLTTEQRQDPTKLTLPPYYPDTPIVREDWKRNYELITAMDAWAGELIQELKDAGEYENTIIFFWSDHGVGLPRAKRWLYDSGTHIPLVIRIPEKFRNLNEEASDKTAFGKPGSINEELVSSLDFAPTVLNLIGAKLPKHFQGRAFLGKDLTAPREYVYGARDRMDERYDIIRSVRDKQYRYIRNYEPFKAYYPYMNTPEKGATMKELRRVHAAGKLPAPAALFMADSKPSEELYDLNSDPHEVKNLAGDSSFEEVLMRMRAKHLEWVAETRDLGLIPESEIVIREKEAGSRYNILRDADTDLIKRIREAANLSIHNDIQEFRLAIGKVVLIKSRSCIERLSDKDPVVRYWANIGLGNIAQHVQPKDAKQIKAKIEPSLSDKSPCVRIAAARALLKFNDPKKALAALKKELASEHEWGRLRAAIVLGEAGELARPLIPEMQACLTDQPNKYITRVANRTLNLLLDTDNKVK